HGNGADGAAFDLIATAQHLAKSQALCVVVMRLVEAQEKAVGQLRARCSGEREGIQSDALHRSMAIHEVHARTIADRLVRGHRPSATASTQMRPLHAS